MALIIATGFVVDDAIVVVENIADASREGDPPIQAAITGARQVGFTYVVDDALAGRGVHPAAAHGRAHWRLFREFAVTLSAAILVSPGGIPDPHADALRASAASAETARRRFLARRSDRFFAAFMLRYRASLGWALSTRG